MDFLSQRIKNMEESATLAMTRKSRELKRKGLDIINLSIGEPDFNTPEFIKEAAKKAIDENFTHYPPVPGYQELREAIAIKLKRDNRLDYKPSQIVVSTGAKQALANCVLSVVNPGDEVLIPAPYWVSYTEIVKLAEGKPVYLYAGIEQDFKITPRQLEEAITSSTRLIMFNSPSNPTGSVYTPDEMEALAQVLLKYPHLFILSDEIYEYIIFEGKHSSFASFDGLYDRVAVVNGVSKGYAMTGWRLGYLAGPQAIADACNKIQGQMTSGTCSIAQRAAIDAMLCNPAETRELHEMVKAFRTRRDLLLHLMRDIPGLKCNKPEGAFYLFPNVTYFYGKKNGDCVIQNGDDLCLYLLDRAQVALVPGSAFGDPSSIRISYATSEEQLTEAMRRIKVALSQLS